MPTDKDKGVVIVHYEDMFTISSQMLATDDYEEMYLSHFQNECSRLHDYVAGLARRISRFEECPSISTHI